MTHNSLPSEKRLVERHIAREVTIPINDHRELRSEIVRYSPDIFRNAHEISRLVEVADAPFETMGIYPPIAVSIGLDRIAISAELEYLSKKNVDSDSTIACKIALTNNSGDITTVCLDETDFIIDYPSPELTTPAVSGIPEHEPPRRLSIDEVISMLYCGLGIRAFGIPPYGEYPDESPEQALARMIGYYRDDAKRASITDTVEHLSFSANNGSRDVQAYSLVALKNVTKFKSGREPVRDIKLIAEASMVIPYSTPITRTLEYSFRPGTEDYYANRDKMTSASFAIRQEDVAPNDSAGEEYFRWLAEEELVGVIDENGRFRDLVEQAFRSMQKTQKIG